MLKEYFRLRIKDLKVRLFLGAMVAYGLAGCLWPGFLHSADALTQEDIVLSNINNYFNPITYTFLFGFFLLLLTRDPSRYFFNVPVFTRMKSCKKSWNRLMIVLLLESFLFVLFAYFLMLLRALYFQQTSGYLRYWQDLLQCLVLQAVGCFGWLFLLACISALTRSQAAGFCAAFLAMLIDYVAQTRYLKTFTTSFIDVYPGKTAAFGLPLVFLIVVLLLAFQLIAYVLESRDYLPKEVR